MSIAENIARIREKMDAAARETGRSGSDIILVGASKMNDAEACRAAVAAGIDALGENRVQEMLGKYAEGAYEGTRLFFIGTLQKNKVRNIVGKVDLIQSVGSLSLLDEIQRIALREGVVQDILLEVNIGAEESKSGFPEAELFAAAEYAKTLPNVRVLGLMAIPPVELEKHGNIVYFKKVHALYVDIDSKLYDNTFRYLSMGMSDDFEDAIRCGANMIRVGSSIFGARHYT